MLEVAPMASWARGDGLFWVRKKSKLITHTRRDSEKRVVQP